MEIDHLTIPVTSYGVAKRFYERALGPLGFTLRLDWPDRGRAYLGLAGEPSSIWLSESPAAGALRLSLVATAAAAVDRFHEAAVAAGGRTEHEPGIDSSRHAGYYAARVLDPDGNAIEAVFRGEPDAAAQPALAA